MRKVTNIIEALVVGKTTLSNLLLRKFLGNLVAVVLLTTIASVMLGILLAGSLYMFYQCLLANGFLANDAFLITGGIVALLAVLCVLFIIVFIRRLRRTLEISIPPVSKVQDIVNAFVAGFNDKK